MDQQTEYRRQAAQREVVKSARKAAQAARDRLVDEAIRNELARRRPTDVLARLERAAARAGRRST